MEGIWKKGKSEGCLSGPGEHGLHMAFSRKQGTPKQYVQDKVWEQAAHVKSVLSAGGHFFLCGGTHMGDDMAKKVEQVLSDGVYREHCEQTGEILLDITHTPNGHSLRDGGSVRFVGSSKVVKTDTVYYIKRVQHDRITLHSDQSLSEASRVVPLGEMSGTFWATAQLDICQEAGVVTVSGVHSFTDQSVVTFDGCGEYFIKVVSNNSFTAHTTAARDVPSRVSIPFQISEGQSGGWFQSQSFDQLKVRGRYIAELWG